MKYLKLWSSAVLLLIMVTQASAQGPADVYRTLKGNNGQSYLLAQAATGGVLYTDVYFRIGTVYETDSMSGLSLMVTRIIDARIRAAIRSRSIRYHSTITPAQMGYHFECSAGDMDYVLSVIRDKVLNARFDEESTEEARAEMRADIDSLSRSDDARAETAIKRYLWGRDYRKLDIYGDRSTYARISTRQFTYYHDKCMLPLNNTIAVTGTFGEQDMLARLQKAFEDFRTKEFNPELVTSVIEFKPVINAIQITAQHSGPPMLTISYQNPGARQDRTATYAAYMLSALINDRNGRIASSLAGSGITGLKAIYDCNNFQGTFTIMASAPDGSYISAFRHIDSMIGSFYSHDYFSHEELRAQEPGIAAEFAQLRSQTHTYMTQVARYRFSGDENYFSSLSDSVRSVSVPLMQRYIADYFTGHAGVRCLYIDSTMLAAVPDSQRYLPVSAAIADLTFIYPNNVTDIDTVTGRQDLHRLIQYLTINPDMHVQINGFSDKGEFIKAYDTTVISFIRNTPTFRKAMPQGSKARYLRIEMMRAMKIAKALYEAGITEDRITGTSMTFSSDSDEEAARNRKCTLTLEKIQPRPSLYEYHFGKKKEEEIPVKQ